MKKVLLAVGIATFFLAGCLDLDKNEKDWTEVVQLTVASETVKHNVWGSAEAIDGINIIEDKGTYWFSLPLNGIEGFNFEAGYEYRLKVKKTHLSNPPADGSSIIYTLLEILSKTQ